MKLLWQIILTITISSIGRILYEDGTILSSFGIPKWFCFILYYAFFVASIYKLVLQKKE